MIEIVFSDSACGSLKLAQQYGKGSYLGGCTGVFISKSDGSKPTSAEIATAQKEVEERQRLAWENSSPMDGNPKDVFGFHLMLSIGTIAPDNFLHNRQTAIDTLWSIYPNDCDEPIFDLTTAYHKTFSIIQKRLSEGEDIRIWYSNQPDELCGLYWFVAELQTFAVQLGSVYIVKLPEYFYHEDTAMLHPTSWGEIAPKDWHRYLPLTQLATPIFRQHCAAKWHILQQENAPLRAMLNGQLLGVSETIYDTFIRDEIDEETDEFQEAMLIGRILSKYRLGIGDAWIAHRIENMIQAGTLSVVRDADKDMPTYHRTLRRNYIK